MIQVVVLTASTVLVYVWYIPTSKMIDASELDEELRKQLESLGYLE